MYCVTASRPDFSNHLATDKERVQEVPNSRLTPKQRIGTDFGIVGPVVLETSHLRTPMLFLAGFQLKIELSNLEI